MASFRCTLFWRNGDAGWTENYYRADTDHDAADDALAALFSNRRRLSTVDVHCIARRVCQTDTPRDGMVTVHDLVTDNTFKGSHLATEDPPAKTNLATDALLLNLTNNWSKFNRIFIRGLPDGVMSSNGQGPDWALWKAKLTGDGSFAAHLMTNGWLIKVLSNNVPRAPIYLPITHATIGHFTTRKVGRPFGLRRGRRGIRPPA